MSFLLDGFRAVTWQQGVMYLVGFALIYLAIQKDYEPALLLPMGFGAILVNLPSSGVLNQMVEGIGESQGIIQWLFETTIEASEALPLLLFIGIGAMIDFGPLLSNPKMLLFGAAAQFGIFFTMVAAVLLGFDLADAASIGIIGAADGPTSILVSQVLHSSYVGPIAVAAYSYMALVPIILCFALLLPMMVSTSAKRQEETARTQLAGMTRQLTEAFSGMERALDALAGDEWVRLALEKGDAAHPRAVYAALVGQAAKVPEMTQLMIVGADGVCLCALRGQEEDAAFDTDWGVLRMADGENAVFFGEAGRVAAVRRAAGGYLLAEISGDSLSELLSRGLNPAYGVMLLGKQWRLIDDSRTTGSESRLHELRERMLAGEALSDGDAVLTYTTQTEPISGFTLLLSQPRVFNREMTHLMVLVGVTLGAVSLLLCLWGALVLSRQVTRPVREMTAAMKRVQLGELSARVVPRGEGELGQLAVGFNQMVAECELNLRRSVERQKELNDTRIRMMQSQLNPHFLYNTLDSMKWMGVTHGVPQVATLAEDLAKILRASISGDEFVTLGQELELLERYIDIQLIRFEDRFACEIEVDDALMGCMVPKLVLQPIVENAVIHGVRDMDDGYIKIWAEADAGDLRLFVQDNGRGMEKPQDGPLGFGVSGRPGEHLGMFNVDSILRLHFGDAYGLSVRSRPGEGCLVMVRLPMRREKA